MDGPSLCDLLPSPPNMDCLLQRCQGLERVQPLGPALLTIWGPLSRAEPSTAIRALRKGRLLFWGLLRPLAHS